MAPAANSELRLMRSADIQATAMGDILSISLVCPDSHRVVANDLSSGRRCHENHDGTFVRLSSRIKLSACSDGPADHRYSGFAWCHDHNRRQTTSARAPEVQWSNKGRRQSFHPILATLCRTAQGRAERAAHHD